MSYRFNPFTGQFDDVGSPGGGSGDVTAASNFGTDNVLIRSDGTGKGVQASGISVDDSDNVSLPSGTTLKVDTITEAGTSGVSVFGVTFDEGHIALADSNSISFENDSEDNSFTIQNSGDSGNNSAYIGDFTSTLPITLDGNVSVSGTLD